MRKLVRIRTIEPVERFCVRFGFTDGTTREVDLEPYLCGPVFEPIRNDPEAFRAVKVDHQLGTIVWDNGADIDPDVLYKGMTPAWMG